MPRRGEPSISAGETTVDTLAQPFIDLWSWVDRIGGYPGKVIFICGIVMLIIGGLTWYGNKR